MRRPQPSCRPSRRQGVGFRFVKAGRRVGMFWVLYGDAFLDGWCATYWLRLLLVERPWLRSRGLAFIFCNSPLKALNGKWRATVMRTISWGTFRQMLTH